MKDIYKKIIVVIILITFCSMMLGIPEQVEARINLKKAFKCVGKACKFVINLPDKATRWMGPVIGPVASFVLTKNILKHKKLGQIFKKAGRINQVIESIEEQKEVLAEVKGMYQEQAKELTQQAEKIRSARDSLKEQLIGGDISFDDYKKYVVAIDELAEVYDNGADKFNKAANKVNLNDVVKMLGNNLLKQVLGQVKNIAIDEMGGEILKLIKSDVVKSLIAKDGPGVDGILDALVAGDILGELKKGNYDDGEIDFDSLKERIRDRVKEMLKENKQNLKDNWKGEIGAIVKGMIKTLEEEGALYKALTEVIEGEEEEDQEEEEQEEQATDEDGDFFSDDDLGDIDDDLCPNGYEWDPRSGVGCIQSNCYDEAIKNAHWDYTGRCVCGSSGSMYELPTDPNQECRLAANDELCPGCVYACVALNADCP